MILSHIIAVGFGGALGAMARFGLSNMLGHYGVLTANIIGCFLIGALLSLFALKTSVSQTMHLFLTVGLLGGFTTFSAFSVETFYYIEAHKYLHAAAYAIASVGGGLCAFILGRLIVKHIL